MTSLLNIANWLDGFSNKIGKLSAWLAIVLMGIIVADVVLRRWFIIGSTSLQELEWHLHGALFLLCLGYAYIKGAHVRIELFRENWSDRKKIIIEIFGLVFLLIPFCIVTIKFGFDYTAMSFANSEKSAAATGLGALWIIKGVMVFGIFSLLLPAISALIKCSVWLMNGNDTKKAGISNILSDHQETT